ncbi:hypothetical protein D3C74_311680 [compost metagenome]
MTRYRPSTLVSSARRSGRFARIAPARIGQAAHIARETLKTLGFVTSTMSERSLNCTRRSQGRGNDPGRDVRGRRFDERRRADHRRARWRPLRVRCTLRAARRCRPYRGAPVRPLDLGRGRRGVRGVRQGPRHPADRRGTGRHVPCLPLHGRPAPLVRPGERSQAHPADRRRRDLRDRVRSHGLDRGPDAAGLRAVDRDQGLPGPARAVAGRPLVHRGRGDEPGPDRAPARAVGQRSLGPRLPRARGAASGLPPAAPDGSGERGVRGRQPAARLLRPGRAREAGERQGRRAPRRLWRVPRARARTR